MVGFPLPAPLRFQSHSEPFTELRQRKRKNDSALLLPAREGKGCGGGFAPLSAFLFPQEATPEQTMAMGHPDQRGPW